MRALQTLLAVGCLSLVAACGVETIVHGLEEREANQIVELFADNDIPATKAMLDTGRTVSFSVTVPAKSRVEAIRLLNRHELPRRPDQGYTQVFKESGLIPTSAEEKAKKLAALEGEIERQLKLIEGILDVQVQLVMPEDSALRMTQDSQSATTASVTVKYMPGAGGTKPLSEPQVQAIVAAGVEKLTPDNVVVVMTPAGGAQARADGNRIEVRGTGLKKYSNAQLNIFAAGLIGVVLFLALWLIVAQIRLNTVRNRLNRLQNEIARARRRTSEGAPAITS